MTPPRLTNATPTVARAHANHTCALAFQEQENFRTENAGRPCSATLDKTRQGGHHDNTTNMIQTCGLTSSDIRQLPAVNSKEQNVPRKRQVDRLPLCSVCDTVVDECLRSVVYSLHLPRGFSCDTGIVRSLRNDMPVPPFQCHFCVQHRAGKCHTALERSVFFSTG